MRPAVLLCLLSCLQAQDYELSSIVKVGANLRHADGAAAPRSGEFLLFTDAPAGKIMRFTPNKGVDTFRENTGGASGLAFDERGRLYMCEPSARRLTRLGSKGDVEVLASAFEGKPLNGPNDLALRHDGHVWFTDPAFGSQLDRKELPFFGIYHLTPKNELSVVWRGPTRPGGIALSPNGRVLYATDADARLIRMWDLDRGERAANERVLVSNIEGVPLGLRTDEKGSLYVAARGLFIYSPEGKLLRHMEFSEPLSNVTFGDPDFQSLYFTVPCCLYRVRVPYRGAQP